MLKLQLHIIISLIVYLVKGIKYVIPINSAHSQRLMLVIYCIIIVKMKYRNVATNFNSCFDRVASTGYMARIYAKTKGKVDKQTIAREVAQMVDKYLTYCGLTRISYNANESLNDNSIYEIILTYSGHLHENRRNFI